MASDSRSETYGIGEWYGRLLTELSIEERRQLAETDLLPKGERPDMACPFRSHGDEIEPCAKKYGICSLRKYVVTDDRVVPGPGRDSGICSTCPHRFEQDGLIYSWIGEELLGTRAPIALGEIGFLEDPAGRKVGRIDGILVHPDTGRLDWCALEKQAVYFSGPKMELDFEALRESTATPAPPPVGRRRPDFRSSGPKRLMPQLQTKVPTLRRWGKKMAVVVDQPFFDAMGEMETVESVSNGDIIWFVVGYELQQGRAKLAKRQVVVTTLESSVEGLTGGRPVSRDEFEAEILRKLPQEEA